MTRPDDIQFMRAALRLAAKGRGKVHPNPLVGAILVKNGRTLASGAHLFFGGAHAEVNALRRIKKIPRNATLYCTLEPCLHIGKTPPCVEMLLKKDLKQIVIGMKDPNPQVSGRSILKLEKNGVAVRMSVLRAECEHLNRDFKKWILNNIPYVTVKAAQTLDGKIATASGESKWITGSAARKKAHEIRSEADLVLVGIGTVLKDDPRLSIRLGKKVHQPYKAVLDSELKISPHARLFKGTSAEKVYIFTSERSSLQKRALLARKAHVIVVSQTRTGHLEWGAILSFLGRRGVVHVLIEGGGETIGSAIREKIADEAAFFISPKILGGKHAVSSVSGEGFRSLGQALSLKKVTWEKLGDDFLLRGRF